MIKSFIVSRLYEASTWRGLILFITGVIGYNLTPEQQAALVTVALAIVGAIAMFTPDNAKKADPVPLVESSNPPESPNG